MSENLNTQVAKALGITTIENVRMWAEDSEVGPYELDYQRGTYPDGHETRLPDWSHDASAALSLPLPDGFCLHWDGGEWEASIPSREPSEYPAYYAETCDTPAEAICGVFVTWKTETAK